MTDTLAEGGHSQVVLNRNCHCNVTLSDPVLVCAFLFGFAPSFPGKSVIIQFFWGGVNRGYVTGFHFVFLFRKLYISSQGQGSEVNGS